MAGCALTPEQRAAWARAIQQGSQESASAYREYSENLQKVYQSDTYSTNCHTDSFGNTHCTTNKY